MAKVAIDPTNPSYVYASVEECSATAYCQYYIYRSVDRGVTWKRSLTAQIETIAVQAGSPGVVYATRNDFEGDKGIGQLYRSADHGRTWQLVAAKLENKTLGSIAVDPRDPNVVLITNRGNKGTDGGELLRTTDGGKTWTESRPATVALDRLTFSRTGNAVFASADETTLVRSADGGATWTTVLTAPKDNIWEIATSPLDPREVYVATSQRGIYRSTDEGLNFSLLELPGYPEVMSRPLYLDRSNPQTLYSTAYTTDKWQLWAYTLPMRADVLPQAGDPLSAMLPTLAVLAAALSLLGLRLREEGRPG